MKINEMFCLHRLPALIAETIDGKVQLYQLSSECVCIAIDGDVKHPSLTYKNAISVLVALMNVTGTNTNTPMG